MRVVYFAAMVWNRNHGISEVCPEKHAIPRGRRAGSAHSLHAGSRAEWPEESTLRYFYQPRFAQNTDVDSCLTYLYVERIFFHFPDFCFWQRIF